MPRGAGSSVGEKQTGRGQWKGSGRLDSVTMNSHSRRSTKRQSFNGAMEQVDDPDVVRACERAARFCAASLKVATATLDMAAMMNSQGAVNGEWQPAVPDMQKDAGRAFQNLGDPDYTNDQMAARSTRGRTRHSPSSGSSGSSCKRVQRRRGGKEWKCAMPPGDGNRKARTYVKGQKPSERSAPLPDNYSDESADDGAATSIPYAWATDDVRSTLEQANEFLTAVNQHQRHGIDLNDLVNLLKSVPAPVLTKYNLENVSRRWEGGIRSPRGVLLRPVLEAIVKACTAHEARENEQSNKVGEKEIVTTACEATVTKRTHNKIKNDEEDRTNDMKIDADTKDVVAATAK